MMTDDPLRTISSPIFDNADQVFLYIYIIEMFLKLVGLGVIRGNFGELAYLEDPWNLLDGGIVIASVVTDYALPSNYVDNMLSETGPTKQAGG